jgi:hypothetical protein
MECGGSSGVGRSHDHFEGLGGGDVSETGKEIQGDGEWGTHNVRECRAYG